MITVKEIETSLLEWAPASQAEEWDNVGLLVGNQNACVENVLVCLDITQAVMDEAVAKNVQLIITHHPIIFQPMKQVLHDDWVFTLIERGISVISLHTNLDKAVGGVNDVLAASLGLENIVTTADGFCRVGTLPTTHTAQAFADRVALILNTTVRVSHAPDRIVERVAICGGSGGDILLDLCDDVDAVVSGEIRHHEWLAFNKAEIVAVEAGHHATEVLVVDAVANYLTATYSDLNINICKADEPYIYISKG